MQIGSFNPLNFLPGNKPAAGKTDDSDASAKTLADAAARVGEAAGASQTTALTPEQEAAGVVVSLQSDATQPQDLVYGNGRKAVASSDDADTAAMALRHSQALERMAGSNTSLSVDSNGVLLAKPVSAAEAKAQAFVHNAVTAMRDYADAQERQKGVDTQQKLAARFKLFG